MKFADVVVMFGAYGFFSIFFLSKVGFGYVRTERTVVFGVEIFTPKISTHIKKL